MQESGTREGRGGGRREEGGEKSWGGGGRRGGGGEGDTFHHLSRGEGGEGEQSWNIQTMNHGAIASDSVSVYYSAASSPSLGGRVVGERPLYQHDPSQSPAGPGGAAFLTSGGVGTNVGTTPVLLNLPVNGNPPASGSPSRGGSPSRSGGGGPPAPERSTSLAPSEYLGGKWAVEIEEKRPSESKMFEKLSPSSWWPGVCCTM